MAKKSVKPVVQQEVPAIGRPLKENRAEIILSNGLSARQWDWIKREAANKVPPVDAAYFQRWMIDVVIAAIEASRTDVVELATPKDDQKFEKLVKQATQEPKRKSNHNIRR